MDTVSAAAAVGSLAKAMGPLVVSLNSLKKDLRTLNVDRSFLYLQDMTFLAFVFKECELGIQTTNGLMPESIEAGLYLCREHLKRLNRVTAKWSERLQRYLKPYGNTHCADRDGSIEQEMDKFNRDMEVPFIHFRDAVVLVQNLFVQFRTQSLLLDMSGHIASMISQLIESEEDLEPEGTAETIPEDKYGQETRNISKGNKQGVIQRLRRLGQLANDNFTVDATVLVEKETGEGPLRHNPVPLRAKLDTGCDSYLISYERIIEAGINLNLLRPIEKGRQIKLESIGEVVVVPEMEVKLTWYQNRSMKSRDTTFLVVKDAPFDLLLSSEHLIEEIRSPALILARRRKNASEINDQHERRKQQLQTATGSEKGEFREGSARAFQRRGASSTNSISDKSTAGYSSGMGGSM